MSEVNILRELNHEHIVKYHDRIVDKENAHIYIIMELITGGELFELISKNGK